MSPPNVAADAKIYFRQLEVSYRTKSERIHALGPIDLDVREGEFLSIVGPSGCGKSTLLRVISGLLSPTAGEAVISLGKDTRVPISTVFQDFGILPWKTVLGNASLGLVANGVPRAEARKRAMEWIGRAGLTGFENRYPHQLSGGMRQRVAIARSFAVEPEILLLDEPFAALDAQMREVMQDELLRLCQTGNRTVVLITHSLEEAILLSDRVAVMSARPGRVIDVKEIPFGQMRDASIRETPEFAALRTELWDHLRTEVDLNRAAA